jgi:hypothetical protein
MLDTDSDQETVLNIKKSQIKYFKERGKNLKAMRGTIMKNLGTKYKFKDPYRNPK